MMIGWMKMRLSRVRDYRYMQAKVKELRARDLQRAKQQKVDISKAKEVIVDKIPRKKSRYTTDEPVDWDNIKRSRHEDN